MARLSLAVDIRDALPSKGVVSALLLAHKGIEHHEPPSQADPAVRPSLRCARLSGGRPSGRRGGRSGRTRATCSASRSWRNAPRRRRRGDTSAAAPPPAPRRAPPTPAASTSTLTSRWERWSLQATVSNEKTSVSLIVPGECCWLNFGNAAPQYVAAACAWPSHAAAALVDKQMTPT